MGLNFRTITSGIRILPRIDGSTAPTVQGDLAVSSVDGKLYYNNGSVIVALVGESTSSTITNKTIIVSGPGANTFNDGTDNTKEILFDASTASTGTVLTLGDNQTTSQRINFPNVTATDTLVTNNFPAVLTNKTISGASNTLTNIPAGSLTGTVALINGGTGIAAGSANAAFDALSPMTTVGDIIYEDATPTAVRLPIGSSGQVLTVTAGIPSWMTPSPGFQNPMTTAGDIIVGGVGGAAQRLGATTNGFILTLVSGTPAWVANSGGSAPNSVGTFDSQAPSANGLVIASNTLYAQSASATVPGMVNNTTQTFSGAKTFSTSISSPTITGSTSIATPLLNLSQIATPSNPAASTDDLYFKSNDLLYALNSSGSEVQVGSVINGAQTMLQVATPSNPPSGSDKIYFKSDGQAYILNSSGLESVLSSTLPLAVADIGLTTSYSAGSNAPIKYDTKITDNYNAYSTSTGLFTCPSSGDYLVSIVVAQGTNNPANMHVAVNGTAFAYFASSTSSTSSGLQSGSVGVKCNAGDTISITSDQANTYIGNVPYLNYLSISQTTGLIATSANPTATAVALTSNYTSAGGASNPIKYDTVIYDTTSSYSPSTGLYTAPLTGEYHVSTLYYSSAGPAFNAQLYKNGTGVAYNLRNASFGTGSLSIHLTAGDTISVSPDASTTFDGNVPFLNYWSIEQINGSTSGGGSSYTFADSLVNTSGTVTLVGDTASPGASQYYGTNGSSTLGYYALPSGTISGLTTDGVVYATSATTVASTSAGTAGQVLTSNGTGVAPTYQTASGGNPFDFFASSQVTTADSGITATSFTTFSNSPAFTFTPNFTGTYKVYSSPSLTSPGTSLASYCQIINTSGGATLLNNQPSYNKAANSAIQSSEYTAAIYSLTSGTSYVFDLQGKVDSGGTAHLEGNVNPFYMFAERIG